MNASMVPVIVNGHLDFVLELAGPDCDVLLPGDVVLAIGNVIPDVQPLAFLAMALPECSPEGMFLRMHGDAPHCAADSLF